MVTAILKFEIRNTFAEWEQAFYSHQPIARAAGIFEIYHGHEPNDEKKGVRGAKRSKSRAYAKVYGSKWYCRG